VLEVSFQVTRIHVTKIPECHSGGWLSMYFFNLQRGGLNLSQTEGEDKVENSKTIPLFVGSPKILPFIASSMFEVAGFPGLNPLPGSLIQYFPCAVDACNSTFPKKPKWQNMRNIDYFLQERIISILKTTF
jgi:hypothetical protein